MPSSNITVGEDDKVPSWSQLDSFLSVSYKHTYVHVCGGYSLGSTLLAPINEPYHEKTNVLHMRKQRRRSASW